MQRWIVLTLACCGLFLATYCCRAMWSDDGLRGSLVAPGGRGGIPTAESEAAESEATEPPRSEPESRVERNSPVEPTATSSSQETLTLGGHLESKYRSKRWGAGDFQKAQDPLKSVAELQRSPDLNPKGKDLSPDQWRRLEELVGRCNREREPLYDRVWGLRKEAMIRSAQLGRFESESYGSPASMLTADLQQHTKKAKEAASGLRDRIAARLGVAQNDWRFTQSSTSAPDGVSKQVVTWFTRGQEPEFFAAEALEREMTARHSQAFRDFFSGLP